MAVQSSPLHVYLLAGVKTTTCAFNACKEKLETQLRSEGVDPVIRVLFPYGDCSRSVIRQVLEVRSDLSNRMKAGRIGGRNVWEQLKDSMKDEEGRFLLIGHSGGGAAAYQAAKMLEENGMIRDFRVVQVGSPRTPIHPRLQDKVSYFHSIDRDGKQNDPITRIGTWGGWIRKGRSVPRWSRFKYAPGYVEGIPVIGGHADYFRNSEPFVDTEAVCNLDKTIGRVGAWLKGWL
ncbi:hypothetical protein PAT3040_05656 [Paenibacillus agaridevorans]|uniref:Fungal lipase-type domain-containing protein n=1 Tax=Paenibacillus agaridevorans TaxID=171404 RepID=A0A2R5EW03_9BACL|nr:hypothetical protein [Paenibacillus agaridevorans]GBG10886.1 hypothetical protein PAT3040_05656 [Paenibacillus agaridevorans]